MSTVSEQELQQWLKEIQLSHKKDKCRSFITDMQMREKFSNFVKNLKVTIRDLGSVKNIVKELPTVGQVLGHISWVPSFFVDKATISDIIQCFMMLIVKNPVSDVEKKSTTWAWQQISRLLKMKSTSSESPSNDESEIVAEELSFSESEIVNHRSSHLISSINDHLKQLATNQQKSVPEERAKFEAELLSVLGTLHADKVLQSMLKTIDGLSIAQGQFFSQEFVKAVFQSMERYSFETCTMLYERYPDRFRVELIEWVQEVLKQSEGCVNTLRQNATSAISTCRVVRCCLSSGALILFLADTAKRFAALQENPEPDACILVLDCLFLALEERGGGELDGISTSSPVRLPSRTPLDHEGPSLSGKALGRCRKFDVFRVVNLWVISVPSRHWQLLPFSGCQLSLPCGKQVMTCEVRDSQAEIDSRKPISR